MSAFVQEFTAEGDFAALYEAQDWLSAHGYSYGSLCSPDPVAIMRGNFVIAKWRNLTQKERAESDGTMTAFSFRTGPVKAALKQAPWEDAK